MRKILIIIDDIELTATISDNKTADEIYNALPFKAIAQRWGDEIFFDIPVKIEEELEVTRKVEVGDIACWSFNSTFCIFFGKTPVSRGKKPRAFSYVNVFGKIEGGVELLKDVKSQSPVLVKKSIEQKSEIPFLTPGFIIKSPERIKSLSWR